MICTFWIKTSESSCFSNMKPTKRNNWKRKEKFNSVFCQGVSDQVDWEITESYHGLDLYLIKSDLEELRVQLNIVRNLLQDKVHETFGVNHVYPTQPLGKTYSCMYDSYIFYLAVFLGLTLITGEVSSIEYWRPHIDILTYEDTLIHYSAVLYLSSSGQDFTGGSFNRIDYTGGPYQISGYSSEGPCQTSEYSSEGPCHRNCAFNNVFHPSKNSLGMS